MHNFQHASVQHKIDKTLKYLTHKGRTLDLADFFTPSQPLYAFSRFETTPSLGVHALSRFCHHLNWKNEIKMHLDGVYRYNLIILNG